MSSFSMILATHGGLANGLLSTVEMIMGPQEKIHLISLIPGEGIQEIRSEMELKLEQLKDEECVFIVTDLYGGTPFNCSFLIARDKKNIRLLTGVNLPMLVQFCSSAAKDPDQLTKELEEVGKEGVQIINPNPSCEVETSLLD